MARRSKRYLLEGELSTEMIMKISEAGSVEEALVIRREFAKDQNIFREVELLKSVCKVMGMPWAMYKKRPLRELIAHLYVKVDRFDLILTNNEDDIKNN